VKTQQSWDDKQAVEPLLIVADSILDFAVRSASVGEGAGHWTILAGCDEGLLMLRDNWVPLASLRREKRADQAFRVRYQGQEILVEADAESAHLVITVPRCKPQLTAKTDQALYTVTAYVGPRSTAPYSAKKCCSNTVAHDALVTGSGRLTFSVPSPMVGM
jgi:hypothetical protein